MVASAAAVQSTGVAPKETKTVTTNIYCLFYGFSHTEFRHYTFIKYITLFGSHCKIYNNTVWLCWVGVCTVDGKKIPTSLFQKNFYFQVAPEKEAQIKSILLAVDMIQINIFLQE